MGWSWRLQAVGCELQNALDLLWSQAVEHLDDFSNGQTIFEVLEDRRNGDTRSSEDPCAADLARDALHRRTF